MHFHLFLALLIAVVAQLSFASPISSVSSLARRLTYPVFPPQPASCPICEQNYGSINSCAQAAPVLANFSMIIFNPGAFIDVIKCACTDTFQSVFPQCVDCFTKTNQTDVLATPDLPSIVSGMREICALESTLLGNTSNADGETTPSQAAQPSPTTTTSWASHQYTVASLALCVAFSAGLSLHLL